MSTLTIHQAFLQRLIKPSSDDDYEDFENLMEIATQQHAKQEALAANLSPAARRAMALYNDWTAPDPSWPRDTLARNGMPYAYHEKLGRWVPTSERFGFSADLREWLDMMDDRKDYTTKFQTWYDQPRPTRQPYVSFTDNCDDYEIDDE